MGLFRGSSPYAVEIESLSVFYGELRALKDVNLRIPRNTAFAVMGPSGCGKSTLLRTINRLIDLVPDARVEGCVKVDGIDVYSENVDVAELRRNVGMVFQVPNPFPHLTIYDNVAIGPKMNGLVKNKKELDELVEWALRKAALWDEVKGRLDDYPGELSGGQRQRLCIARALALKPRILLMDEPTANVDPMGTRKIEELIVELKQDYTIVLVTHSAGQAARVSDHVAFIYMGEVVEVGPTGEVFTHPKHELTESFISGSI